MSDLRLTETGNAGPISELELRRIEDAYLVNERNKALAWMDDEKVKRIYQRQGATPGEKLADKRID